VQKKGFGKGKFVLRLLMLAWVQLWGSGVMAMGQLGSGDSEGPLTDGNEAPYTVLSEPRPWQQIKRSAESCVCEGDLPKKFAVLSAVCGTGGVCGGVCGGARGSGAAACAAAFAVAFCGGALQRLMCVRVCACSTWWWCSAARASTLCVRACLCVRVCVCVCVCVCVFSLETTL
jgi:hypothetical protein